MSMRPFSSLTVEFLTAIAILVLLLSVTVVPGLVPLMGENERAVTHQDDRLASRGAADRCLQQNWPNFERSCLKTGASPGPVEDARLIKPQ